VQCYLSVRVHRNFIKFTIKMHHNTKSWVAFREAGRLYYPLQYYCLLRMLALLDSVLALDDGANMPRLPCWTASWMPVRYWHEYLVQLAIRTAHARPW
jgi:hypothetical protein